MLAGRFLDRHRDAEPVCLVVTDGEPTAHLLPSPSPSGGPDWWFMWPPDRETIVKIGKHAENHFVGVPCGILDQGVSGFGRKDHLVFIDCRGPHFATVPLPLSTVQASSGGCDAMVTL